LSRLCSPCFRPSHHLSGPPSSASSPFPYPYRVIGMVMIALVGLATFDKSGAGATSILQSGIRVSPKRQLRNATLAPSCALYAFCAAARGGCACILGTRTLVVTYTIPRHTRVSLPIGGKGLSKSSVILPSKSPLHDPPMPLNHAGPTTISSKGRSPTLSKYNLSWFTSLLFLLQLFRDSLRRRTRSRAYRGAHPGQRLRTGGASTGSLPGR
jgi:hypothetical protein